MSITALKEVGSAHSILVVHQVPSTQMVGHELGVMYQDPTDKSVETKRQISHWTFTLWGGEPYPFFSGEI